MNHLKPELYAEALKRVNGARAVKIAEHCMKSSDPKEVANLPVGPVFFYKDKNGRSVSFEKDMKRTHNFWIHVWSILKKK